MKCFTHPDRDAVAVCSVCGQGLCEGCSVRIAGKLYCKSDADKIFGREAERAEKYVRPASITVAAILFFIFGALGIISGLVFSAFAGSAASFTSVPFIGPLTGVTAAGILLIGLVILVFGILYLVAGNWLWDGLRRGGILGIALSIISILVSLPLLFVLGPLALFLGPLVALAGLSIVIDILLIVLITVGWSSLR